MALNPPDEAKGYWQLNGRLCGELPIQDRGLAYGDGLFETCFFAGGDYTGLPCWPFHKARALLGCERLGLPVKGQALEDDLQCFLRQLPMGSCGVIKLIVTRGQGGRGYTPPTEPSPNILWQLLPAPVTHNQSAGVHLTVSTVELAKQPALAGLKHLNRLEYVLAARLCSDGIPLLLDTDGCLVETLSHNIFCLLDGQLVTPILNDCGVKGVFRELVAQKRLAPELDLNLSEQVLTLDDLACSTEVFIGNSVRGVWPVTGVNLLGGACLEWPAGPVTCQLQQAWLRYISLC